MRAAVGLRIGSVLVREHQCICGTAVQSNGHHGLSCRRSAGRQLRHKLANDVIARALKSADAPSELEPPGLVRGDGKRPDGATLTPWSRGKCLVWDFTCSDTFASSHIVHTSLAAGRAAADAEVKKRTKYSSLAVEHNFVPVAIETMGAWGMEAIRLIAEIGGRIASVRGKRRSASFLRQRLDIAIQRGNAAAIHGTFGVRLDYDDDV